MEDQIFPGLRFMTQYVILRCYTPVILRGNEVPILTTETGTGKRHGISIGWVADLLIGGASGTVYAP